jgi:hypothetical protein
MSFPGAPEEEPDFPTDNSSITYSSLTFPLVFLNIIIMTIETGFSVSHVKYILLPIGTVL